MTEVDPNANMFDDGNFVTSSPLNGKRGVIVKVETKRSKGNEKYADKTQAVVTVFAPGFAKAIPVFISVGEKHQAAVKAADGTRAVVEAGGTCLIGPSLDKKSVLAGFATALKKAGFPIGLLAPQAEDLQGMVGADLTFRAVEVNYGGSIGAKVYDRPAEFHGRKSAEEVAALIAQIPAKVEESEAATPIVTAKVEGAADIAALDSKLATALKAALAKNPVITRAQLMLKVGPELPKAGIETSQSPAAFARLLKDEFYSSVEGVSYDQKEVKLVAA